MKKRCFILVITLVITLGIGGCNNAELPSPDKVEAQSSPTVEQSSLTQTETPSTPAPSEFADSTLGNLHIALATDKLLNKYNSFYEYINDEDGARLIIWTDTEIKDFSFISIKNDNKGTKLSYFAGDTLFSANEFTPEKPFVVNLRIPGTVPAYGISFVDENGAEKYYTIQLSGRGVEEAPPYYFLEFENGGSILPTSPLSS